MAQIVWGTVGFAVLVLIAGGWMLQVAWRALKGDRHGAADPPAVVVRPDQSTPAHVGPRLRWESDLALRAVQCDQAARLERRKREAADVATFRAVKRGADVVPIRGER